MAGISNSLGKLLVRLTFRASSLLARPGMARHGWAWRGAARQGLARHGAAWKDSSESRSFSEERSSGHGPVRLGVVRCGKARLGVARQGKILRNPASLSGEAVSEAWLG